MCKISILDNTMDVTPLMLMSFLFSSEQLVHNGSLIGELLKSFYSFMQL